MHLKANHVCRFGIAVALVLFVSGLISNPSHLYGQGVLPSAPALAKAQSMWDIVKHGGPVLIILGLCSVLCLTLMIERYKGCARKSVIAFDEQVKFYERCGFRAGAGTSPMFINKKS